MSGSAERLDRLSRGKPRGARRGLAEVWLEVSLQVRPELAEPAAELLARVADRGAAIESHDQQVRVRAWIASDHNLGSRRREIERGLWHLSQIEQYPEPSFKWIEAADWETAWRRSYRPLRVGSRLIVLPSWSTVDHPDRIAIHLEPGMAFGTGAHPTTQHCLESLEELIKPGDSALDLGCGSGILAIAAAALGADSVLAMDIDQEAVSLSTKNVSRNPTASSVEVVQGSLSAVPEGCVFDLIVVNIRASVIEGMLGEGLVGHAAPGGALVLSGMLEPQVERVAEAASSAGAQVVETLSSDDWRTLVLRAPKGSSFIQSLSKGLS